MAAVPSHEFEPPSKTSLAKIEQLQRQLREDPESAKLRDALLFEYGHLHFQGDPERVAQLVWHVRNRPDNRMLCTPIAWVDHERFPDHYAEVAQAWEEQLAIDPLRPTIARGAARFLFDANPDRARTLLVDAATAHPDEAQLWIDMDGSSKSPEEKLSCLQRARSLGSPQPNLLSWLCQAAVEANDLEWAARYGNELLAESHAAEPLPTKHTFGTQDATGLRGNTIRPQGRRAHSRHHAHSTLGVVALRNGDTQSALEHLRASAAVDTDARLSSYGPSFELAFELSAHGFHNEVRDYLIDCKRFWKKPILEQWIAESSEGKTPTFAQTDARLRASSTDRSRPVPPRRQSSPSARLQHGNPSPGFGSASFGPLAQGS